ncbi:TPA: ABC transporter ATP-binding protein [Streptococcus pyogenes]|uniref:ABC transporter transmembrane domain-containing protein n=2 Tax=Peptoniphilaceae TaxID=1570339 RepID=UPI0026F0DB87|nr:ABC transporter ATP-binding protein [Finegoldia magna]HEQ2813158.1 ABC transporter ATP-binding protein [Streptococcus pyogenes]HEQ2814326.1 ABC transporter ATP-binding protein [Streptococcus pyogenes]HER7884558.1 ABC transporter ATP-binding protein [Streptococcus pyogenes]HER7885701.1 ABC transporter ATP-binding protein [Streptococcus pyogenes]
MNNMFDWREHKKIIDKFILPQKKKIIYLIIVILLGIIASMAIPYVFGNIIDLIVIKDLQLVLKFIIISLFLNIFQNLSSVLEEWIGNILSIDCSNTIKEAMFSKILDTRYEFLNSYGEGELVSRIENTGDKIVSFYIDLFSSIVMIMFSIIISAYIMIMISLKLFIIAIILLPLTYGINYIFKNTIISKQRDYITKLDAYSDYLIDTISNLTGIKLNNLEKIFKGNYKKKLQDLKNVSISNMKINITVTSLHDLITIILSSLILFISAKLIILGNLSLGNIVAFSSYMEKLHSSIKKIGDLNLSFNEVIVDLERYKKIMDYDSENKVDGKKLSKVTSLKFKNVSFKYDNKYILKNFSFEISKPGLYGIVGENGSGKTTIFNLISKFYTNYEGEILINGNEISDYKDEDLRNEVLFLESKPFILRDNLTSNITLLEKNKVDELYLEKIIQFLELERIEKYSTKNLKDTLSKGEQEKIQLARLLISKKSLILLDEVLSGLDKEMKEKVISKIKERSKNNILIIISHEYEIQRICDEVFLMPDKNT